VTPLLISAVVTLMGATPPRWCKPAFAVDRGQETVAPSLAGMPGLFEVPGALSVLDRSTDLSYNNFRLRSTPGATTEHNLFVGFGFLPRLSVAGRASWTLDSKKALRDISAGGQFLVAREGAWTPSLAVGAEDFGGRAVASNFVTRYVVASKTLFDRVRVTGGMGKHGGYSLGGPFGGVEFAPCTWVAVIGENAGPRHNYGIRIAPFGLDARADRRLTPTLDVLWRERQGRIINFGLRIMPSVPHFPTAVNTRADSSPVQTDRAPVAPADTLRDALVRYGFENVRVSRTADTVSVAYENRVYNRQEWDALGRVLAETARHAAGARTMNATILRVDLPMMNVASGVLEFQQFVNGTLSPDAFARQLVVTYPTRIAESGPASNRSRFRVDLTAVPRVETLLFTEISAAEVRTSLLPEAAMQLGSGLTLTGRRAVVLSTTSKFPARLTDPNADQLLLHGARAGLPFGFSLPGLVTQGSVGRFGPREVGGSLESDLVFGKGRFSLGGITGMYGRHAGDFSSSLAIGTVRYRNAALDLETSVNGGQFLHGDVGATVDMRRRFGLMDVGFFGQSTTFAKMAGAYVAVPLAFARDPKPGPVRIKMPGYYEYSQRSQILTKNFVRTDVALRLDTGTSLSQDFRDRDRLNEVELDDALDVLRAAALSVRPVETEGRSGGR